MVRSIRGLRGLMSAFLPLGLLAFSAVETFASNSGWCDGVFIPPGNLSCHLNFCVPQAPCTKGNSSMQYPLPEGGTTWVTYEFCSCPGSEGTEQSCCHLIKYTSAPKTNEPDFLGSCEDTATEICETDGTCHVVWTSPPSEPRAYALCNNP